MTRYLPPILFIALVLAASLPASAGAASARETALKRKVASLTAANKRLTARANAATRTNSTLLGKLRAANGRIRTIEADAATAATTAAATIAALTAARDAALAGLPAAIGAAPIDRFWELVFTPARAAWPCDSYYQGSAGYWSLDFTSSSMC